MAEKQEARFLFDPDMDWVERRQLPVVDESVNVKKSA